MGSKTTSNMGQVKQLVYTQMIMFNEEGVIEGDVEETKVDPRPKDYDPFENF